MLLRKKSILATRCNRQRFKYIKKSKKNKKQKSKSSKSCKVVSKLLIPEELMFEILSLVPVHCLINSARYVCKSWATTIGSSLFAEVCLHRGLHSKPGLYVEHCGDSRTSYFLDIKDDVNGQFESERTDLGIPPKMGRIVSSCDGILLLCNHYRQLSVVNPILKCWLGIPPPLSISYDCRFTIACIPHTTMFKLFFIDILRVSGAFWYVFYVLRIGIDNSLKEIARKKAPREPDRLQKPLYNGGNDLYYRTMMGITVVDVDKEIIVGEYPLTPVKIRYYRSPIWLSMGDHLSFIELKSDHRPYKYKIYILDFDSGKWSLYHEMGPYPVPFGHVTRDEAICLWINDQIIFQVYIKKKEDRHSKKRTIFLSKQKGDIYTDNRNIYFSYNVKTRQLKKIEGITEEENVRVWLHTNNLVSLPNTST